MDDGVDYVGTITSRVFRNRGDAIAVALGAKETSILLARLRMIFDEQVEVRMVLGSACTTTSGAVDQFVAALQLPYEASRGWEELIEHLSDRAVGLRQCVVVTDAAELLMHEGCDEWEALVDSLHWPHSCLGGGWATLVLADTPAGWRRSTYGNVLNAADAMCDPVAPTWWTCPADGIIAMQSAGEE